MVSEGRNHASTATTNLLSSPYGQIIKTNIQIFKITIKLICLRPHWQMSAVKCTSNEIFDDIFIAALEGALKIKMPLFTISLIHVSSQFQSY